MSGTKRKKLNLWIKAFAVFAIVFSFTFSAAYAWFYKESDSGDAIVLNPADLQVEIIYEDKDPEQDTFKYVARAATKYGQDDLFNMCIDCAEVTVINRGEIPAKLLVSVAVLDGVSELPQNVSPVKYAVIVDRTRQQIEDARAPGQLWPDYKGLIQAQMDAFGVTAVGDMNEKAISGKTLAPPPDDPESEDESHMLKFLIAFWVDYTVIADPAGKYQYAPNMNNVKQNTFDLTVKVTASDMGYTWPVV